MAFIGLNIKSKGCKSVELTKKEIKMIKKINGYTRMAVIYFLAVIFFALGGIVGFIEHIDIISCIFFILFALIFAKLFYSHIHQQIEYAYYGTVTKKEVRYGVPSGGRSFVPVPDYSETVQQKTRKYCIKYEYVSVLINGIEFENIYCHYLSGKIEVGSDVIIAKGYNVHYEPTIYKK